MSGLSRDVLRWVLSLDLSLPVKNPKRDLANGFLLAEILSRYFPSELSLHSFENVASLERKRDNWKLLQKFFQKHGICISQEEVEGMMSMKENTVQEVMQKIYNFVGDSSWREAANSASALPRGAIGKAGEDRLGQRCARGGGREWVSAADGLTAGPVAEKEEAGSMGAAEGEDGEDERSEEEVCEEQQAQSAWALAYQQQQQQQQQQMMMMLQQQYGTPGWAQYGCPLGIQARQQHPLLQQQQDPYGMKAASTGPQASMSAEEYQAPASSYSGYGANPYQGQAAFVAAAGQYTAAGGDGTWPSQQEQQYYSMLLQQQQQQQQLLLLQRDEAMMRADTDVQPVSEASPGITWHLPSKSAADRRNAPASKGPGRHGPRKAAQQQRGREPAAGGGRGAATVPVPYELEDGRRTLAAEPLGAMPAAMHGEDYGADGVEADGVWEEGGPGDDEQQPSIEYSRKPRLVEYTPYSYEDYAGKDPRRQQRYWELKSGLGFDETEEVRAARSKLEKMRSYAQKAEAANRDRLAKSSKPASDKPKTRSRRDIAKEYASQIPKPAGRLNRVPSGADGRSGALALPDAVKATLRVSLKPSIGARRGEGAGDAGGANGGVQRMVDVNCDGGDAPTEEEPLPAKEVELRILQARHEADRERIDRIRREMARLL